MHFLCCVDQISSVNVVREERPPQINTYVRHSVCPFMGIQRSSKRGDKVEGGRANIEKNQPLNS